jgi:hypothetical protein
VALTCAKSYLGYPWVVAVECGLENCKTSHSGSIPLPASSSDQRPYRRRRRSAPPWRWGASCEPRHPRSPISHLYHLPSVPNMEGEVDEEGLSEEVSPQANYGVSEQASSSEALTPIADPTAARLVAARLMPMSPAMRFGRTCPPDSHRNINLPHRSGYEETVKAMCIPSL